MPKTHIPMRQNPWLSDRALWSGDGLVRQTVRQRHSRKTDYPPTEDFRRQHVFVRHTGSGKAKSFSLLGYWGHDQRQSITQSNGRSGLVMHSWVSP